MSLLMSYITHIIHHVTTHVFDYTHIMYLVNTHVSHYTHHVTNHVLHYTHHVSCHHSCLTLHTSWVMPLLMSYLLIWIIVSQIPTTDTLHPASKFAIALNTLSCYNWYPAKRLNCIFKSLKINLCCFHNNAKPHSFGCCRSQTLSSEVSNPSLISTHRFLGSNFPLAWKVPGLHIGFDNMLP